MNNSNFTENKEKIISLIKNKCPNLKCPVCTNDNMILGDGYFAHDLQSDLSSRQMGGFNIPTVPIVCSNCGYIREFSAGVLGLIQKKDNE